MARFDVMSTTGPASPKSVPTRFDVFLSYNSRDRAIVERVAQRLRQAGFEPWLDRWSLTAGRVWHQELGAGLDASAACAVFVGADDFGPWELEELAVALQRAVSQRDFRVFAVLLPGLREPFDPNDLPHFLRTRMWVDFRRGGNDERALQDLINAIKGVPFGPGVPISMSEDVAPYRGLLAFGEDDARFFFGRDREVQRLLEKLKSSRFVAVLGPSGSGKSSLVRAGLVPELRAGALADGEPWQVLVLRPGEAPLTALAAQLTTLQPGRAMHATLDELGQDSRTLHLYVELALADCPRDQRVLVVVDQLEEVFTLCRDERERGQLLSTLLYAASVPGGRTVVVVALRADFYVRCADYRDLAQLISARQMLVGSMGVGELRQAIEEPARRVGLELEEGLSDTILADVSAEPGALPLLEHALFELWERRRGGMLTLEGYRHAGGVHQALARRADNVFVQLTAAQQQLARRTLLRLTQPGEGTEDARRRATRTELTPAGDSDDFDEMLGRLVDARLLTTGRDEAGLEIVDVSHEALIRGWPRLRGWIDTDRAGLLVHRRLTDAAQQWENLNREPGSLFRGARLGTAVEWAGDHADDLSELERSFLAESRARERGELEAAKRRTRRLRILASGLAALTVVVALLAVSANDQRTKARQQEAAATSLALATLAAQPRKSRPDVSLALTYEAYRERPRPEASADIIRALLSARRSGLRGVLASHDPVFDVAFSPDGKTLASGGSNGTIGLWDATARAQRAHLIAHPGFTVSDIAFSPDGKRFASASGDHTVLVWSSAAHKRVARLQDIDTASAVAFSPDGRMLASAGDDGSILLWKPTTHRLPRRLTGDVAVFAIAFSPDGGTLAAARADGTVDLWNPITGKRLDELMGHTNAVTAVAFSPDGKTLASGGADNTIVLWSTTTRTEREVLTGHTEAVNAVAFSPDGRTLASSSEDGTVRLWNTTGGASLARFTGHTGGVYGLAFSPDGRILASAGGADDTVRLWNPKVRTPITRLTGHTDGVDAVAFSPDGRAVASAGDDATVRLWNPRTGNRLDRVGAHNARVYDVTFTPDGKRLASAGDDGTIGRWSATTLRALRRLAGDAGPVYGVAFSHDGRTLASANSDGTIRLWSTTGRAGAALLTGHTGAVNAVAFSPDDKILVSASKDRTIRLWSVATRRPLDVLTGHVGAVNAVAFSPDGKTLGSAGDDGTVRLWDPAAGTAITRLTGHTGAVNAVAFSPDGKTLASASDDDTIRLWNAVTHTPLGRFTGHTGPVNDVAFSPDGKTLASASDDKTIRLWELIYWNSLPELRAIVCGVLMKGLSRSEWNQYAPGIPYRRSCP